MTVGITSFEPRGDGGMPCPGLWGWPKHTIPDARWLRTAVHSHGSSQLGKEDTARHSGPHRGCAQERREQPGRGQADFVVSEGVVYPVLWGRYSLVVGIILWAGPKPKPTRQ